MRRISAILLVISLACGICSARPVKGRVVSGEKKLVGVVVSDGFGFAVTDNDGRFSIELSPEADFVYVVTPPGFSAPFDSGTPVFYIPVEKGVKDYKFDLVPYGSQDSYTLLAMADPQTQNDRHFDRFESETVADMKALAGNVAWPAGICLGDIAWDVLSYFDKYKKAVATVGIPFYPVIGNHDHDMGVKGDHVTEAKYRESFGPNYYAFNLGRDYYIVLDNIIYDTNKKYVEDVGERQLRWLEGYRKHIPSGSGVFICMHAHVVKYFDRSSVMPASVRILEMFRDCNLSFLTGHTHVNSNHEVTPFVTEHNIASAGGAWWTAATSKDGTPCGYKVFESDNGRLSWYYKSTGMDRDHQFAVYDRGTFVKKPNAVVAKVWDWDEAWKVEWYEDGRKMGGMERFESYDPDYSRYLQQRRDEGKPEVGAYKKPVKSSFYFAAVPGVYAKEVKVVVTDRFGREYSETVALRSVDVQAHRGGMGLMPENTIEAMLNAVELGVNTLELDLNISRDGKVVVSHDPWMNSLFAIKPDGEPVEKARQKEYALYRMDYDSIRRFDTGSGGNPRFPDQRKVSTRKPLLTGLIDAVEEFTSVNGYTPVNYNIEIKSSEDRDNVYSPRYDEFTDIVMEVLLPKGLGDRLIVQCFDTRTLNYIHNKYPQVVLAYLVDAKKTDFEANMAELDFVPEWYSPHYSLVDPVSLAGFHKAGMKVVPWTVDKPEDIRRMLELGVDAIISNYPDRVLKETRKY